MVGPTPPQLQIQPPPPAATSAAVPSAEEDALKRNTDCVYFLASPLTCKKGSECDYRHSDIARLNPRDCWYWLNGSCLNPKCAFRHPPLDGFLGAQVPTPKGSSVPPVASAAAPVSHVPYGSSKQGVPCIFFQQGFCLKGDRCPFFHAPMSVSNKAPPHPVTTEKTTFKKPFNAPEKFVQENNFSQANIPKSGELPGQARPAGKLGTPLPRNNAAFAENAVPPSSAGNAAHHRHTKPKSVPPANGNLVGRSHRVQQFDDRSNIQNKDEEISREVSPGFDVLVDDELRGTDFYHGEDQYGRNEGRNEYDIGHSADVDQDMYRDAYGYDSHDRLQGRSGRVQHRESAHVERSRHYGRAQSPEAVRESDLRHRLSKQKRVNGLRSVISHDYAGAKHVEDRGYQRDRPYVPSHDSSRANRLQGRIKLPSRSSSPSSERPPLFSSQQGGRLRDRIKGRVQEDLTNSGPRIRRDVTENNSDFTGPRRLSELKGRRTAEENVDEQHALGKRKFQRREQMGGDGSFEGPMSLQELLKRKKRSETGVISDKSEDSQPERKVQSVVASAISRNGSDVGKKDSDPPSGEKNEPPHDGANELEAEEEGVIVEEADDHREANYDDYEQDADGEEHNFAEGGEEEYLDEDDDDGDDFAKKMGVVFS